MISKIIYGLALIGALLTASSECIKDMFEKLTTTEREVKNEIQTTDCATKND